MLQSLFPILPRNAVTAWDNHLITLIEPSSFYFVSPDVVCMVAIVHQAIFENINVYSNENWSVSHMTISTEKSVIQL